MATACHDARVVANGDPAPHRSEILLQTEAAVVVPVLAHEGGWSPVRRTLAFALVYLVAGIAAATLQPASVGTVFWPPAGVAVAALLVSPRRSWPLLLAALAVVDLGLNLLLGTGAWAAVLVTAGNVLTPLVVGALARVWAVLEHGRPRRVARYLLAIALGAAVGAVVGAAGMLLVDGSVGYPLLAVELTVRHALGVLLVSPFLQLLMGRFRGSRLTLRDGVSVTVTVVVAVAVVAAATRALPDLRLLYLLVLPMAWVATRWRLPGAAVGVFVLANALLAAAWLGYGVFAAGGLTPLGASPEMQLFLAVIGASALWFAARAAQLQDLEALAEDRARLLAAVSHELRTPLTSIVGFSEHLLEHSAGLSDRDREAVRAIDRNGRHLARLIEELLQVRQTRRHVESRPERVQLATVLDALVHDRPGAAIELVLPEEATTVWVDPGHLVQILSNLLENALRHGAPPVRIEVVDGRRQTRILVRDQGPGVPDDYAPRLFEEFSQASTGDRRSATGLGLGLAIAQQLARANGGDLKLLPSQVGACFELTVSRISAEEPLAAPPARDGSAQRGPAQHGPERAGPGPDAPEREGEVA